MRCGLVKWQVSRAADTGKPLSRFARRHMARCQDCRNFERLSHSLNGLAEIPMLLQSDESYKHRILDVIHRAPQEVAVAKPSFLVRWRPAFVGASLAFVLALGVLWIAGPFRATGSTLGGFKDMDISPIKKIFSEVESPYKEEFEEINKGLDSVASSIKSFFNTRFSE